MSAASVQRAMYTSPIELLYRWNQYQEERKKFEGFDGNFPPNVLPDQPANPPVIQTGNSSETKWLFGLTGAMFFVVLLLALLPFIIAIYLLVKHGDRMPQWAKIAGWICALLPVPGGSIIAIILVFSTKSKE